MLRRGLVSEPLRLQFRHIIYVSPALAPLCPNTCTGEDLLRATDRGVTVTAFRAKRVSNLLVVLVFAIESTRRSAELSDMKGFPNRRKEFADYCQGCARRTGNANSKYVGAIRSLPCTPYPSNFRCTVFWSLRYFSRIHRL